MITGRDQVRAAYLRCMNTDPERDHENAVRATAQALGLPDEAVRDVVETAECDGAAP